MLDAAVISPPLEDDAITTEAEPETSHIEALKSSSIIGGSSIVMMLIRMVRTKVVALLLGPAGVGLEAVFDSIVVLAKTLFDAGLGTSGVREVAVAAASGSDESVARTVFTLRRVCMVLGLIGGATVFLGADTISTVAFGDHSHSGSIRLLSVIVAIGPIATGWGALLTGMRRIGDLARMSIWGTLAGAALSIPFVYVWGISGIAPYMVVAAGVGLLIAWLYARRIPIAKVKLSNREVFTKAQGMMRLGMALVASYLLSTGAVFVVRILVTRTQGVEAAGLFQAATALSMVYVGFILQAMGTDYFPRLTEVSSDDERMNQTVNEQAEVSFLLALPGVLATLALSPWVISILYSSQFDQAADVLSWQMAGMLLRLVSWPMGFVLAARGRGVALVWTEVAAWSVYVLLSWVGLETFGLVGVGMAFLGLYIFHSIMIYGVVRSMSGFRWQPANLRLIAMGILTTAVALWARLSLAEPWATGVGLALATLTGLFCLRALMRILGRERIDRLRIWLFGLPRRAISSFSERRKSHVDH